MLDLFMLFTDLLKVYLYFYLLIKNFDMKRKVFHGLFLQKYRCF